MSDALIAAPSSPDAMKRHVAAVAVAVTNLVAHLDDPFFRRGLSNDTFIDTYACILARGIAATSP